MTKNLDAALFAVQTELNPVLKTGVMKGGGSYKFAGDSDIMRAVNPLFEAHGLSLRLVGVKDREMVDIPLKDGNYQKCCIATYVWKIVHAPSGEFDLLESSGSGADTLDKHCYKAMTGARKYVLRMLLNMETTDDPDAAQSPQQASAAKPEDTAKRICDEIKGKILLAKTSDDVERVRRENADSIARLKDRYTGLYADLVAVVSAMETSFRQVAAEATPVIDKNLPF